jgi:VanZ family protein/uncharacterized membrane protein YqjE
VTTFSHTRESLRSYRPVPLAVSLVASLAIVLGSPLIGALRAAVLSAFPTAYRTIMLGAVAALATAAVAGCTLRIRDRRLPRFAALGASLLLGVAVARASRSGNANVDAVEAFHFVEYGGLTAIFAVAWQSAPLLLRWSGPALAASAVAICDEWLQWWVPSRAGEMRDVWLNGAAVLCGLLYAGALLPSPRARVATGVQVRCVGLGAAAVLLLGAGFFSAAHLGYEIADPRIGRFASVVSAEDLLTIGRDRAQAWPRTSAPARGFGREDQYLSEGLWHVERRNDAYADGDWTTAWGENRILETYYAPVLETPPGVRPPGHRWPQTQRETVELRPADPATFVSDAHPYPIYAWEKRRFWAIIAVLAVLILVTAHGAGRRRDAAGRPGVRRAGDSEAAAAAQAEHRSLGHRDVSDT